MKIATSAMFVALAVTACNSDELAPTAADETAALPVEQAGPAGAGGLILDIDGALASGDTLDITLTGAAPNERVKFFIGDSFVPGAVCPTPLGGLCMDITNPSGLMTARADANGEVNIAGVPIPPLPDGTYGYVQAASKWGGAGATSNVVLKFDMLDAGGQFHLQLFGAANVVPGVSYDGFYQEGYISDNPVLLPVNPGFLPNEGGDLCQIAADATGTPTATVNPCVGCAFAFDVTNTNWEDSSISGDCMDTLLLDVTTLPDPFYQEWGYNSNYYLAGYGYYPMLMFYYDAAYYWTWATNQVYYGGGLFLWAMDFDQVVYYY